MALKIFFCLLTSPKFDFGEVDKSIFLVVATHSEIVFFLFISPKCEMGDVDKAMIQVVELHF